MNKTILFIAILVWGIFASATEYVVTGNSVNFRSSPNFRSNSNVIASLPEGTRLVMISEHPTYIEATTVPGGQRGFIWKQYVEVANTHTPPGGGTSGGSSGNQGSTDTAQNNMLRIPLCNCTHERCRQTDDFGWRDRHPVTGRRTHHDGCDLAAPRGTNVYAAAAGVVKKATTDGGLGKFVDLEHSGSLRDRSGNTTTGGYTTRYAHLHRIHVREGQRVSKGQRIGEVNSTGLSTGHHLHFEIAVAGRKVDPEKYIDPSQIRRACDTTGSTGNTSAQ